VSAYAAPPQHFRENLTNGGNKMSKNKRDNKMVYSKKDKLRAVSLVQSGKNYREASSELGIGITTVKRWVRLYDAHGPDCFDHTKPGKPNPALIQSSDDRLLKRIDKLKKILVSIVEEI